MQYTAQVQLFTPLAGVLKTKTEYIDALAKMNITTVEDMLLYVPRTHEDLSEMNSLRTAPLETKVSVRGTVESLKLVRTRTGKKLVTAQFTDSEGSVAEVIWFNQTHIKRMLSDGEEVVLTGKIVLKGSKIQLLSPQIETVRGTANDALVHAGRLVAVYPQHEIITSKWLREKMVLLKPAISLLPETLPEDVLQEEELISKSDAVRALHFPEDTSQVAAARKRIQFEEMFHVQRVALEQKKEWQGARQERLKVPMDTKLIRALFQSLQFTPTNSQKIAIYEILKDMEQDKPMSRLLEGDVGSGKTLVATAVMANTIRHGGQCALMVPTEVLARQHVQSIGKTLISFYTYLKSQDVPVPMRHPTVALLSGSVPKKEADEIRMRLAAGTVDLVIGTHALIQDSVQFKDLKLVIVDEQHRFGVVQRQRLTEKGSPHFLAMTATPIPRTLALTAHGHHDLSVLLEKPGNRKPIQTKVVSPSGRKTVELFIDQQIQEGRQVFVICPLISESANEEFADMKSVKQETERLKESFAHRNIAMLHGKMSAEEKEKTMKDFKDKKSDILVSTSVIEVGIDVPNASIIIIEGSERFGLAQLHQFRGRVGRGEHKSHCFLFTTTPEQAHSQRLKAMETYHDGFQLAEIDLQIRGPGELYGTRQSGIPEFSLSSLLNPELVVRARRAAEKYLSTVS
ncbi:ATP-dependent DNA helicase RecG [Candidatus Peregrinibacteria bacterium CG10_big_fil_rev_8_21_14_0_10_49_24]|nr:MAG: ATP-dependent DNA helicase RecG [Candidatus Peregrinibacteria bacterium CG11_big_fil_rev_8_21_14_0_20_49_14]PIR50393.1 MAG: ATP-dependent DNA helicase RecG [Candidatus Peregrinibacteria bacterium CG10_big_fil_rev_8_21_14_0_10_49_24]PJA67482.1 MAG: ATP-dependent DNA helicase RecG [Candidatus Peregrinibacteria bacterium CG_4_9_14_3_um_filter_49_12]